MEPWTRPIFDVFKEYYHPREITSMLENGILEISPLAYMRGRTFKNAYIVADEMKNATPSQMKMLLTRIGEDSRMIVTGDLQQADRPETNGLLDFVSRLRNHTGHRMIDIVQFQTKDIERHPAVKEILSIYKELDE
jgi:phosphate starvation-inducible PhoH-like protein